MKEKDVVTISKEWNHPQIRCKVDMQGINLHIELSDFLEALATEMGNPILLVSKGQLMNKIVSANEAVIQKVKSESIKVM